MKNSAKNSVKNPVKSPAKNSAKNSGTISGLPLSLSPRLAVCSVARFAASLVIAALLMTGCLQTREDLAEEQEQKKISTTVSSLQKSHADTDAKFDSTDSELREITGRIETNEHKNSITHEAFKAQLAAEQKKLDEVLAQMKIFDDTILKAHQRIDVLEKQVAAFQDAAVAGAASGSSGGQAGAESAKVDHYKAGEVHYTAKDWKKAIAAYQKYRDANPRGKEIATATLRIGESFQELGMKSEAKSFYQEVIEKYPKDKAAKTASSRLKVLKK